MLLVLLIGAIALQGWTWRRLRRRIVAREITKLRGSLRYGFGALSPFVLFLSIFLGAVGIEEWSGAAFVSEGLGRALLPIAAGLLGIGLVGWLAFSLGCALGVVES